MDPGSSVLTDRMTGAWDGRTVKEDSSQAPSILRGERGAAGGEVPARNHGATVT
jgi:hypothetical protein